jgi:uncharacterized protein YjbI with pentapeptide repeats
MTKFHIRAAFSGSRILHTVEITRETLLYAPDLRGVSLENAQLNGADLRYANLSGVCLRGARLRGALLDHANFSGADLSYCDLSGASLREANLYGTVLYPAETIGAKFYGAKFSTNDDAAEYARIALEEICRRVRIRPNSVAFRKLQRINGFPEFFIPAQAEMCHVSTWAEEPSHGSRIARVHGG